MNTLETIVVRFTRNHGEYMTGQFVELPKAEAEQLIREGVAVVAESTTP
jgi:hypothetical protein